MSLGLTLKTAREAKGLTTSELATKTHMLVQIVEGLENEDFRRIPAPIYGRGFVKLYCETVGLDPKPLQDEFMELYTLYKNAPEKFHVPSVRRTPQPPPPAPEPEPVAPQPMETQPVVPPPPPSAPEPAPVYVAPPPPPAPEPAPVYVAPPPPPVQKIEPELHATPVAPTQPEQEPEPAKSADTEPSPEAPPRRSYGDLFDQTYASEEEPNKPSAVEMFHDTLSNISSGVFTNVKKVPTKTWRIAAVSIVGIILLVLMGWGIAVLYKATTPQPDETPGIATITTKPATAAAKDGQQATSGKDTATATTAAKPGQPAMSKPATAPTATAKPKTAPTNPTSKLNTATKSTKSVKPGELKQSGLEVPSLYID